MAEQLIPIGRIDGTDDTFGSYLHDGALKGNKSMLKKALDKGIKADHVNDEGQSALFVACYAGHEKIADYLLSAGAKPNLRSNLGLTPVHAACFSGNVPILMKLLQCHGDLRLHDNEGRSVKDWAMLHRDPKKRVKMMEFLDKCRLFAMSNSGQDLMKGKAAAETMHKASGRKNSVTKIIREKIGRGSMHDNLETMATNQHTVGFGQVYNAGSETTGFMSAIPIVSENTLRPSGKGETYNNGAFTEMQSMTWNYTDVKVKKMRRDIDSFKGGVVDLLITEIENMGKLRHPNVLLLMGVCQTARLDGLLVIYEHINQGSLFCKLRRLEAGKKRLQTELIQTLAVQISNALIFLHLRGFVHCSISSHAISLVDNGIFKLGNFEYMVESSSTSKINPVTINIHEKAVFNWMAPELMFGEPSTFFCDMYSYCAVLFECFGGVPWKKSCFVGIKNTLAKGEGLNQRYSNVEKGLPDYFRVALQHGLSIDPRDRKLSFLHLRDMFSAAPENGSEYLKKNFRYLYESGPQIGQSEHQTSPSESSAAESSQAETQRLLPREQRTRGPPEDVQSGRGRGQQSRNGNNCLPENGFASPWDGIEDMDNFDTGNVGLSKCTVEPPTHLKSTHRKVRYLNKKSHSEKAGTDKKMANLQYRTDGLDWKVAPLKKEDELLYGVSVKKRSPTKQSHQRNSPKREVRQTTVQQARMEELSTTEMSTKTTDESDVSNYAKRSELAQKSSSLVGFSYLSLPSPQKTRSKRAKPACHGTDYNVDEEYSTLGKLSTAGSLYTLYNDHSPDRPLGQIESSGRQSARLSRRALLSNDPRTSVVTPGQEWFCGMGSVKDLAQVFQDQIETHDFEQAVLEGKVSSEEVLAHPPTNKDKCPASPSLQFHMLNGVINTNDQRTSAVTPQKTAVDSVTPDDQSACSLTTVSLSEDDGDDDYYDEGLGNSSGVAVGKVASSDFGTESSATNLTYDCPSKPKYMVDSDSTESDIIELWVDKEIRKIKRHLSKDKDGLFTSQQRESTSQDFYHTTVNERTNTRGNREEHMMEMTQRITPTESQKYGQLYFDDEMYEKTRESPPSVTEVPSEGELVSQAGYCEAVLPMNTVLKCKPSPRENQDISIAKKIARKHAQGEKPKKSSKIPMCKGKKASKAKSLEGAYANIVTVRSCLDDLGSHQVTHEMKNLRTGGKKTIVDDTVNARKVVTSFRAQ